MDFSIRIRFEPQSPNVTYGRCRWMLDGKAIAFVGLDESGHSRIFVQDFVPGKDTSSTRRALGAISDSTDVESFGISPDGRRIAISTTRQISTLTLAEGLGKPR